jgi:hypothetical protein
MGADHCWYRLGARDGSDGKDGSWRVNVAGVVGSGLAIEFASCVRASRLRSEIWFGFLQLLFEEKARHLNQTDDGVGGYGGVGVLDAFLEGFAVRVRLGGTIAPPSGVTVILVPFFDFMVPMKSR